MMKEFVKNIIVLSLLVLMAGCLAPINSKENYTNDILETTLQEMSNNPNIFVGERVRFDAYTYANTYGCSRVTGTCGSTVELFSESQATSSRTEPVILLAKGIKKGGYREGYSCEPKYNGICGIFEDNAEYTFEGTLLNEGKGFLFFPENFIRK